MKYGIIRFPIKNPHPMGDLITITVNGENLKNTEFDVQRDNSNEENKEA